MPNKPVPAAATGLPLEAREQLDEARLLVETIFMACADLDQEQGEPLRTVAQFVSDRLEAVKTAIDALSA